MTPMNQSAFARQRGVSQPYISQLLREGVIERLPNSTNVDADACGAILDARKDPQRQGTRESNAARWPTGKPAPTDLAAQPESGAPIGQYSKARAVDATFTAKLKELEYRRQTGDLIDRAGYAKGCEDAAAALGKELEGAVHRLAPLVAGEPNITRCRELITAELNRAREAFADTLMALAAEPRNGTQQ